MYSILNVCWSYVSHMANLYLKIMCGHNLKLHEESYKLVVLIIVESLSHACNHGIINSQHTLVTLNVKDIVLIVIQVILLKHLDVNYLVVIKIFGSNTHNCIYVVIE